MHVNTYVGRWTSAPMGAMDRGRWHRWTVADGRYADYRFPQMADECCADGTARTMGVRRWEPRGTHLRSHQCLADCSATFGTLWGRGSLMSWHAVGRGRLGHAQRQRRQAGAHEASRALGAHHPLPGHVHGTPALTAVAAATPPPWLIPTSAVALPSRSRALTSR